MENYMEKKVSRRSMLGGGLKAAVALGAAPTVLSLLEGRAAAQRARPWLGTSRAQGR